MASMNANKRKSYILSVEPVAYSLTAGTNIPAPLESPPQTPAAEAIRPPTPGGGPLTSHPTTPDDLPSNNLPPTPEAEKHNAAGSNMTRSNIKSSSAWQTNRTDSFRTPMSPASATATEDTSSYSPHHQQHHQPQDQLPPRRKPSSGVRKLLSLSNLRSSFSSSRTSLSLPRTSHDNQSTFSSNTTTTTNNNNNNNNNFKKRPASPSVASTTTASAWSEHQQPRPPLREKKSSSWFKRKSGMFLNSTEMPLDAVDEGSSRPDTRESKRVKESKPAPLLPEFGAFGEGGDLGWDERQFKR